MKSTEINFDKCDILLDKNLKVKNLPDYCLGQLQEIDVQDCIELDGIIYLEGVYHLYIPIENVEISAELTKHIKDEN